MFKEYLTLVEKRGFYLLHDVGQVSPNEIAFGVKICPKFIFLQMVLASVSFQFLVYRMLDPHVILVVLQMPSPQRAGWGVKSVSC